MANILRGVGKITNSANQTFEWDLESTPPTAGQGLIYEGGVWVPKNVGSPSDPTTNHAEIRLGFNNNGNNSGTSTLTSVTPSGTYSYTTSNKTGTHAIDFGQSQNGYVNIQTASTSRTYSMGGWFYITRGNTNVRSYIVDFRGADQTAGYWLFDNLNSMTILGHDGEDVFSHTVPTNQWVHWVLTSDGSSNMKFYENGALVRTSSKYSAKLSTTVVLGTYNGNRSSSGTYYLNGKVDNFFLALSEYNSDQVQAIYNSQEVY